MPLVFLALLFLALTLPASAQITAPQPLTSIVVSDDNPAPDSESLGGLLAQSFSLSSGAYISGVQIGLSGTTAGQRRAA